MHIKRDDYCEYTFLENIIFDIDGRLKHMY